ncbi:hypothetical protein TIFTF001_006726 [Ficus carica]|uniref:Uncharacterized protein n=1 Tax=Ficus carica TaxID=3494 RepID=A0AA87ZRS8_FICCA|nr:hypothetical protein TIFTF001_006726 [Ficus carica]
MKGFVSDLVILRRLGIQGRPNRAPKLIIETTWHPPFPDRIKFNTDRGVANDCIVARGDVVASFALIMDFPKAALSLLLVLYAFEAELLSFPKSYGWDYIWIESDFQLM